MRATCRAGDVQCCDERVKEARAAGERGESARAAHLWEDVALACADEGRFEFMVVGLPLRLTGGTGSPWNPIAIF